MDREKLIQRLMATFLGELEDHVRALERDLLALEKASGDGRAELLQTLFRTVHSLKGAARSVHIVDIEAVCHRLEGILGGARDGALAVGPELLQLLFTTADALKEASERLRAKGDLTDGALRALLPRLGAAASGGVRPSVAAPPPSDPSTEGAASPPVARAQQGVVRVPAGKLDALLARSGELLVARRRVGARPGDVELLKEALEQTQAEWRRAERPLRQGRPLSRRSALALDRTKNGFKKLVEGVEALSSRMAADQRLLEQTAVQLDAEVRRVRMLPFGEACEGLERVVRDLAQGSGKEVELSLDGSDVQIDRSILEGLKDPLMHLVRNAVDHGLEPPTERRARGKPARGRVTVAASLRGDGIEVVVADDGRGLDLGAIRDQARKKRMTVPDDERELARLVFLPGFSTAGLITELSGRGVGLDVVKHRVELLRGTVDFTSGPDRGTRFLLALPLTLTTLRAVLLDANGHVFALPAANVVRLARASRSELGSARGREVLFAAEAPIPVVSLADVLGIPTGEPRRPGAKVPLAVVVSGDEQVAFAVDELLAEQEIVVKSLGARLVRVRNFAGATLLPTGRIALILNAADLVASALGRAPGRTIAAGFDARAPTKRKRVLVVDDSITTRSLEKSILEAAGYEVLVAVDGAEAWQVLLATGADLVVTDVEMPRLDGFALTEAIRGSKRFRDLPVILVTALSSENDKARGLEVGADAYLPKGTFDQRQLLETIGQLL